MVRVSRYFPLFFEEEKIRNLMEEVTKYELKEVLQNFQIDKIPRTDG
jgi:hypothetical protein